HAGEQMEVVRWISAMNRRYPGFAIAYDGFNTPYGFMGPHFANTVRYLSPDGDSEGSWAGRRYRGPMLYGEPGPWLSLLTSQSIDIVIMRGQNGRFRTPDEWLCTRTDYVLAYRGRIFHVWIRAATLERLLDAGAI
ncbi:hypothetical protein JW979_06945, partial [bacterium]|nr:hypothetical protein [candidate division CSSED10-310 bacterium]